MLHHYLAGLDYDLQQQKYSSRKALYAPIDGYTCICVYRWMLLSTEQLSIVQSINVMLIHP